MSRTGPLVVNSSASVSTPAGTLMSYVWTPVAGSYESFATVGSGALPGTVAAPPGAFRRAATVTSAGPLNDMWYVPESTGTPYSALSASENMNDSVGQPSASVLAKAGWPLLAVRPARL